jgi:hypothetical protein
MITVFMAALFSADELAEFAKSLADGVVDHWIPDAISDAY